MMSTLSRRKFLFSALAAPAIVKIDSLMPLSYYKNIIGETDFGFTLGKITSFDEITRVALTQGISKIAQNIITNSSFLCKIRNNDYVKINYVDSAVQVQRIIEDADKRAKEQHKSMWKTDKILTAEQITETEAAKERKLAIENRDKWDNKFTWTKES